jgi:hypothetical protein
MFFMCFYKGFLIHALSVSSVFQTYDANVAFGCFKVDRMLHLHLRFLLPHLGVSSPLGVGWHPPLPFPLLDAGDV